jgi:hypothetical protein
MPMSQPAAIDCTFEKILCFMLPFFLVSGGAETPLSPAPPIPNPGWSAAA